MKYFMQDDVKRLSWSAPIFNDGEVDSKDGAIIADGRIFVSSSKCCDVSRVVSRIGIFRSVSVGNFLGIYHTDTEGKLGQYFRYQKFGRSPSKKWREPPFSKERGAWPPFVHFTLLLKKKRNSLGNFQKKSSREILKRSSRHSLQYNNTDRKYRYRLYLIPGKYRYRKNYWNQHGITLDVRMFGVGKVAIRLTGKKREV